MRLALGAREFHARTRARTAFMRCERQLTGAEGTENDEGAGTAECNRLTRSGAEEPASPRNTTLGVALRAPAHRPTPSTIPIALPWGRHRRVRRADGLLGPLWFPRPRRSPRPPRQSVA